MVNFYNKKNFKKKTASVVDRFNRKNYIFWIAILFIFLFIFYKINHVLLPFYIAIFATTLFGSFVEKCEKKFHFPKSLTSGIITLLFYFFIISCLYALCSISITKTSRSVVSITNNKDLLTTASIFIEKILNKFDINIEFNSIINQMYDLISKHISYIVASAINYGANIVNIIFLFVLAPITTFMMLKDHNLIYEKIRSLLPKKIEKEITELFTNIHESVFKYIEGQTITAVILSVCYSTILFFIGLEHFIVLGVLIGFSSFVPYIGFYSATIITLFSVYNQFYNFKQMLITIILLLIMQIIDCSFITPKIVGNKLGVHPLFIIFGVLASVPLFGFIGIILALPIVGIVSVLVKFLIKKYKNSSYYNS